MLFDSTVMWFLVGTAASAFASFVGAIGTMRGRPISLWLQLLLPATYVPLLAVAVNSAPAAWFDTKDLALAFLAAAASNAVCVHASVFVARRNRRLRRLIAQQQRALAASTAAIAPNAPPRSVPATVLTNASVADYRSSIVALESSAKDFAFVQQRIAPYFNSDQMLRFIAEQRFGQGNAEMNQYIATHQQRRHAFFTALDSGSRYREILTRKAILRYVRTGTHSEDLWPVPQSIVVDLLQNWRQVLLDRSNYYVGISEHHMPLKYHVVNGNAVVLHEPVGKGDDIRLNSVFLFSDDVGTAFLRDFDLVWGLIDPEWRDRHRVARWIEEELIPLAQAR